MKKETWKTVLQVIVSILTAALTALGTTSCMGHGPLAIWTQKLVNLSASAISHTRGCGFLFFIKRDFVTFDFVTLRASQLWMSSKLSDSQQYIAWYRNLCRDQNTRLLFCYLHFILGISLCLTRKCLWTHSISSHTQKTCLYSAESSKNFKIPQSIDHNLAFITPAMNSQECLFISSRSHKTH